MSNYTKFYIVRHGQTDWNVEGRMQGHKNSMLTEEGKQQAKFIADALKKVKFDAVFSSDLLRAKDTAKIIACYHGLAVKITEALREKSHGRLEGRLSLEVRQELKELWDRYSDLSDQEKIKYRIVPDAETLEEVVNRFVTFLREVAIGSAGKTVLMVTHGGVIRSFMVHLGIATHNELPAGSVKNTGYIVVDSDGIEFLVRDMCGVDYPSKITFKS